MSTSAGDEPGPRAAIPPGVTSTGPSAPDPAPDPEPVPAEGAAEDERFGPLALRRYVKEDGRMLILYADEPEPDSEGL